MRPSTRYVGAQKIVDYTNAALMCGEKGTTSRIFATRKEASASPAKSKDAIAMRHDSDTISRKAPSTHEGLHPAI